jgi:hypothetical protein
MGEVTSVVTNEDKLAIFKVGYSKLVAREIPVFDVSLMFSIRQMEEWLEDEGFYRGGIDDNGWSIDYWISYYCEDSSEYLQISGNWFDGSCKLEILDLEGDE